MADTGTPLAFDLEPVFGPVQLVEALLFVAAEPVSVHDLAQTLRVPADAIEAAVQHLREAYRTRGVRLLRHNDALQLVTAPEATDAVQRFLGLQVTATRLSNAALETLSIVAYRQPITRAGVEAVRGVDSSGPLRTLQQRGLVTEVGRVQTAGRPVLYGTGDEFLKQFGLESLAALPPLDTSAAIAES